MNSAALRLSLILVLVMPGAAYSEVDLEQFIGASPLPSQLDNIPGRVEWLGHSASHFYLSYSVDDSTEVHQLARTIPLNPTAQKVASFAGGVLGLNIDGDRMVGSDYNGRVVLLDFSDSMGSARVWTYQLPMRPDGVRFWRRRILAYRGTSLDCLVVSGDSLVVAGHSKLATPLGTLRISGDDVQEYNHDKARLFRLSLTESGQIVLTARTPWVTIRGRTGVVRDDYWYVCSGPSLEPATVTAVDVSYPDHPIAYPSTILDGDKIGRVGMDGEDLFVVTANGLNVVSLRDPKHPRLRALAGGRWTFSGKALWANNHAVLLYAGANETRLETYDLRGRGGYLVPMVGDLDRDVVGGATNREGSRLWVLDKSTIGRYSIDENGLSFLGGPDPAPVSIQSLANVGGRFVVVSLGMGAANSYWTQALVWDDLGAFEFKTLRHDTGFGRIIRIGQLLYDLANYTRFDLGAVGTITSFQSTPYDAALHWKSVSVDANTLVGIAGPHTLRISAYSAANGYEGSLKPVGDTSIPWSPAAIHRVGQTVYLRGQFDSDHHILAVDISDRRHPTVAGETIVPAHDAKFVCVSGSAMFLHAGGSTIDVVDLRNPLSPQFLGSFRSTTDRIARVVPSPQGALVLERHGGVRRIPRFLEDQVETRVGIFGLVVDSIERSVDLQWEADTELHWQQFAIDFVKGSGSESMHMELSPPATTNPYVAHAELPSGGTWTVTIRGQATEGEFVATLEFVAQSSSLAVGIGFAAPNPFSEVTTVRLDSQSAGDVMMDVYDLRGRLVRRHRQPLTSGRSDLVWDGRTEAGQLAASGKYFLRITTPDRVVTRPVMLLR